MTSSEAATSDRDSCVAAYEELRRTVLGGSSRGSHVGLVVILREGVAAWILRGPAASEAPRPVVDRVPWAAAPILSDEVHASVVRVLAGIVLSSRSRREMSP